MALKFFRIPVRDAPTEATELNAFLSSHRVLAVDRQFVNSGENSFWALCVDYLDTSAKSNAISSKKNRIDYREVLPPEEFAVFAKLRDLHQSLE